MKMVIKSQLKTNASYYQKEGQNYPHQRCSREAIRYQPNPQDYKSDISDLLEDDNENNETTTIS